jgi:import inner membrane translocase subunit TIM10
MSFFGGSGRAQPQSSAFGPGAPSQSANQERLEQAAMEVDMVSDLFNRLVASCHAKCIPVERGFHEGTLNKGEGVCIDRWACASACRESA